MNQEKALDLLSVNGGCEVRGGIDKTILAILIVDSCWSWMIGTRVFIIQLSQYK